MSVTDGGHSWQRVLWGKDISFTTPALTSTRPPAVYVFGETCRSFTDVTPCAARLYMAQSPQSSWRATGRFTVDNQAGYTTSLAVDPQNPATLYLAAGSSVLKSTDAGAHWQSIAAGLPAQHVVAPLVFDPQTSGTVYAGLSGDYLPGPGPVSSLKRGTKGVFKTTDGGATWTRVSRAGFDTLAVDPGRPTTIYGSLGGRRAHIARSTDGGLTWVITG